MATHVVIIDENDAEALEHELRTLRGIKVEKSEYGMIDVDVDVESMPEIRAVLNRKMATIHAVGRPKLMEPIPIDKVVKKPKPMTKPKTPFRIQALAKYLYKTKSKAKAKAKAKAMPISEAI
jgi:hypothetical protein